MPPTGPVDEPTIAAPHQERRGRGRVRVLSIILLVMAAAVFLVGVLGTPGMEGLRLNAAGEPVVHSAAATLLLGLVFAAAFYVTEIRVVHLQFRREAQAFSLSEIPLAIGLFWISPELLVLANVTGVALALIVHRKQRDLKLLFNTSQVWLAASVAVTVFGLLIDLSDPLSLRSFGAAFAATLASSLINTVTIVLAIILSEGRAHRANVREVVSFALLSTATTTSLGLVGVDLMWRSPEAAWLLVVPAGALYLASRAYTSQKTKHESLELLYESSRILHEYPAVEQAMGALLAQARETFRTEIAEITLFPGDGAEPALRTSVTSEAGDDEMVAVPDSPAERSFSIVARRGQPLRSIAAEPAIGAELHMYLAERGLRDAMIAPLRGETRVIGAMLLGNRLGQVSSFRQEELPLFQTLANNASVSLENGRLERTLSRLTELKEELRHQAYHDTLTGLANRALFNERVEGAVGDNTLPGIAVMYLDLDDFKTVNDTLGHKAGDILLIEVAGRLQSCLRPGDMAARLGGDEFAVLLASPDTGNRADVAAQVAERILNTLRFPVNLDDRNISVRCSIGIAISKPGENAEELIRNADVAMYRAKARAKGRYAVYEPGMRDAIVERLRLRSELLRAVDEHEFVVHYQPLVDLSDDALIGAEALVRWQHPERGIVMPGEFIGLAEESGLVLQIGEFVLEQACREAAEWKKRYGRDLVVSINLSAKQLKHPSLLRTVTTAIRDSGVLAHNVILEITERDIMDDTEANLGKLHALKALGVQLAIDDFGTGYSSLAYLRRFPVDVVKVAQDFVDHMLTDDEGILAHAIIELSHALGMSTIAEGIEHEDQATQLRAWGCEVGQGYLWSRAVAPDGIRALYRAAFGIVDHDEAPRVDDVGNNVIDFPA